MLPGLEDTPDMRAESLRTLRDATVAKIPLARRMRDARMEAALLAEARRLTRELRRVDGPTPLLDRMEARDGQ